MNCLQCQTNNPANAQVSAARGETERALELFTHAEKLALEMLMRPLLLQARAGSAQLLTAASRESEAEAKRREARATIDEIAGLFEDEKLRAMFVGNATRKLG